MDQILNQVSVFSSFYEAVSEENYSGLYSNLAKLN